MIFPALALSFLPVLHPINILSFPLRSLLDLVKHSFPCITTTLITTTHHYHHYHHRHTTTPPTTRQLTN
ncbi:uncharacterized protein BO66DRAFT_69174 [Aspergillus aculeatinus CBS 121060]|uniref:Uncharacterized protein n=1 Tax=Aspergillus aculeatinus CBS 121060 TaxID=1448322 RepID=A0ACD1HMR0_9EURO|nr:hypothetical protein BO66DRAFT_69174 [Aspergillus aculeatinus CBS 121060]RAH74894.1 hypothetical protein BO66DRAFT_69174 [Aspergillus aculeatinus CBS 121060]